MKKILQTRNARSAPLAALVIFHLLVAGCSKKETPVGQVHTPKASNVLMLSESQVRLANVTTQKAARLMMGESVVLNARLVQDEDRTRLVNARVSGRIERLYTKETGRELRTGQPIVEIYSEQLLTLQREFLLALETGSTGSRNESFLASARKKLIRYGLTEGQIDLLSRTREIQDRVTYLSPSSGVIASVMVTEGQYVEEGAPLYKIEDINHLWVEAELYPGEVGKVTPGDPVSLKVAGQEGWSQVIVTFVSPQYRANSQVTIMRAAIANNNRVLKPGMAAQVIVTRDERKALALPLDAVIREESGSYVFVSTDTNTFERRAVTTGMEGVDRVEIISGLQEGDVIAVTGAYLLHSELLLKGGNGHSH